MIQIHALCSMSAAEEPRAILLLDNQMFQVQIFHIFQELIKCERNLSSYVFLICGHEKLPLNSIRYLSKCCPEAKIVVMYPKKDKRRYIEHADAGVLAYVREDIPIDDLQQILILVSKGYSILSADAYEYTLTDMRKMKKPSQVSVTIDQYLAQYPNLNKTECQIIEHIYLGKSNKEIAKSLFLSEGRVKNIITHLFDIFQVHDRHALVTRFFSQITSE